MISNNVYGGGQKIITLVSKVKNKLNYNNLKNNLSNMKYQRINDLKVEYKRIWLKQ